MSTTMYDSVTIDAIPADAAAVAGYVNGRWPTYHDLLLVYPGAYHLSITVAASEDAECLDIETGDAVVSDAPVWFMRQIARGVWKPVVYTSFDNVPALNKAMSDASIHRSEYRIWSAHYVGIPHLDEGCDATQYTDKALGRNLDASLCSGSFFKYLTPTPKPNPLKRPVDWFPADEARWEHEFDALKGKKGAWAALRRRVLIRVMKAREVEIRRLATTAGGWEIMNRRVRYAALTERTQ